MSIIFFIFKKLFLKSAYQNDLKTSKLYKFQIKINNSNFIKNDFQRQSQIVLI